MISFLSLSFFRFQIEIELTYFTFSLLFFHRRHIDKNRKHLKKNKIVRIKMEIIKITFIYINRFLWFLRTIKQRQKQEKKVRIYRIRNQLII